MIRSLRLCQRVEIGHVPHDPRANNVPDFTKVRDIERWVSCREDEVGIPDQLRLFGKHRARVVLEPCMKIHAVIDQSAALPSCDRSPERKIDNQQRGKKLQVDLEKVRTLKKKLLSLYVEGKVEEADYQCAACLEEIAARYIGLVFRNLRAHRLSPVKPWSRMRA